VRDGGSPTGPHRSAGGAAGSAGEGNWGRWGPDDQRGALNLISADQVRSAARQVRTGRVYPLGMPLTASLPQYNNRPSPQRFTWTGPTDAPALEAFGADPGVGANEDVVVLSSHIGTHMDALSHVFADGCIYNGHPAAGFTPRGGAARCGIECTAAFAGRAVLLDVEAHTGGLEDGQPIDAELLEATRRAEGVEVGAGDILLVRTGWVERFAANPRLRGGQAGLGLGAVPFVRDHDLAAVGADNGSVECLPFDGGVFLGVHIELLVRLGVTLLEHLWLADLAADGCHEMLLSVGGLPVPGATGSPVNPIAIG